jgi:hypothetical protein
MTAEIHERSLDRRGFFSTVFRNALRSTAEFREARKGDGASEMLGDFDNLPIAATYPQELFEEEARRLGIDFKELGRVEAIKRIVAHHMRTSPPQNLAPVSTKPESVVRVDPVFEIQMAIEGIFRQIMPSNSARAFFRIKALSDRLTGDPGWYFWLEDFPGVYCCEVVEANQEGETTTGRLCIRYFPALEEELFNRLSVQEQVVRSSDFFDSTGSPTIQGSLTMNETLFVTGSLDVKRKGGRLQFVLRAPDWWVTRHTEGLWMERPGGQREEIVRVGERDRNLPAWQVSWSFLDLLLSCLCCVHKTAPDCVALFENGGVSYGVGPDGIVREIRDTSVKELALAVSVPISCENLRERFNAAHFLSEMAGSVGLAPAQCVQMLDTIPEGQADWISRRWWDAAAVDIPAEDMSPG